MNEDFFAALDILRPVAKKHGLTEAECALRWMIHHSMSKRWFGDAVIIGASSRNIKKRTGSLPEEVVQAVNAGWEKTRAISGRYWY